MGVRGESAAALATAAGFEGVEDLEVVDIASVRLALMVVFQVRLGGRPCEPPGYFIGWSMALSRSEQCTGRSWSLKENNGQRVTGVALSLRVTRILCRSAGSACSLPVSAMSASLGEPIPLASYPLPTQAPHSAAARDDGPLVSVSHCSIPKKDDGLVTVAVRGNGIHVLNVRRTVNWVEA